MLTMQLNGHEDHAA